jgi:thiamine-phosphate pyrophosphorylase
VSARAAAEANEPTSCRLYLVTPPALDPVAFRDRLAEALDAGDVACVQLRLKDVSDDALRRACDALRPLAQDRGVAFLLNDRPDLAAETGCDGVHVGQQDASYEEARRILGPDRIVGVTCHDSRHLAMEAAEAGADYVAFGAFFPTGTKEAIGHPTPEILEWWSSLMTVPCVAIGGITPENCGVLVTAGADFLAVVSAVWNHPEGPGAAVKLFNHKIAEAGRRAGSPS